MIQLHPSFKYRLNKITGGSYCNEKGVCHSVLVVEMDNQLACFNFKRVNLAVLLSRENQ